MVSEHKLRSPRKLHLGCGGNLIPGWLNVDLDPAPGVVALDLTQPLPFDSGCADFVYSEHFIEHITREQALGLLAECRRVLKPGGVMRTTTPSLRKLVDEYLSGRLTEWTNVAWIPATSCRLLNEGLRLWGHQFVYDRDELDLLFGEAGFARVEACSWRRSAHAELSGLECRPFHDEVIVEAGT
jgi:predicted SAM-dependent methyltransferase